MTKQEENKQLIQNMMKVCGVNTHRELEKALGVKGVGNWVENGVPQKHLKQVALSQGVDPRNIKKSDQETRRPSLGTTELISNMEIAYKVTTKTELAKSLGLSHPSTINGWISRDSIPEKWLEKTYRDTGIHPQYSDEVQQASYTEKREPKPDLLKPLFLYELLETYTGEQKHLLQDMLMKWGVFGLWEKVHGLESKQKSPYVTFSQEAIDPETGESIPSNSLNIPRNQFGKFKRVLGITEEDSYANVKYAYDMWLEKGELTDTPTNVEFLADIKTV